MKNGLQYSFPYKSYIATRFYFCLLPRFTEINPGH